MKYYIFLDDSGQLHPNYPFGDYFVYGGIVLKDKDLHGINKSYSNLVKTVKKENGIKGELKTSQMTVPMKRRLLNKLSKYSCHQAFVTVEIPRLVRLNFSNKKDVVRFKNYVVRRLIDQLICTNKIPKSCEMVEIHIDNQNVAHSARDSLEDHLMNFFNEENYYLVHTQYSTTSFKSKFAVYYKDSESNYLIQAADLLANSKFSAMQHNPKIKSLFKKDYTVVHLP